MSQDSWKQKLTPEQYRVLRQKGTEVPGSGKLLQNRKTGTYTCAACGHALFTSQSKYDSTTPGLIGWPSFSTVKNSNNVKLEADNTLGMQRVEVTCAKCGSHLGHVFDDESSPTGQHYCINSVSLDFKSSS